MSQPASTPQVFRSLLYYAVFYGVTVPLILVCFASILFGRGALRTSVRWWGYLHRFCLRWLVGITARIEGEMPQGAVLVAIKHESFFEAIDLPYLFDYPVVIVKQELRRIPVWGWVGEYYGHVPVARDQGAAALRKMLAAVRRLSGEGRPVVIFPEGTRVPHGQSPALQSGFAGLYKLLDMPVVPVAVDSGPFYHRWWKCSGVITYRVGAPIPAGLPRTEMELQVQAAINVLNWGNNDEPTIS